MLVGQVCARPVTSSKRSAAMQASAVTRHSSTHPLAMVCPSSLVYVRLWSRLVHEDVDDVWINMLQQAGRASKCSPRQFGSKLSPRQTGVLGLRCASGWPAPRKRSKPDGEDTAASAFMSFDGCTWHLDVPSVSSVQGPVLGAGALAQDRGSGIRGPVVLFRAGFQGAIPSTLPKPSTRLGN